MSHNHIFSDIAIRLTVSYRAYNKTAVLNNNAVSLRLVKVLYQQGFILNFNVTDNNIVVELKYNNGRPLLKSIKVISTPGHRVYWNLKSLRLAYSSKNFGGVYIISTPKGLCTSTECLLSIYTVGEVLLKIQLA